MVFPGYNEGYKMEKKILVVDDEENTRTLLKVTLGKHGYQVLTANDGQQGWEILQSDKPDLLISDINMPVMDGIQLLKRVRENTELKNMPIIMLTAKSSDEEVLAGLSDGADHYVTKPFTPDQILLFVRMALEEK
jgi:two-component system, OmpR family, alkaline phosphatase synthesis response regulator PhoP